MNAAFRFQPNPQKVAALVARVEGQVAQMTAAAPGAVESVLVEENQYVEKGDLLIRMAPARIATRIWPDARAEYLRARIARMNSEVRAPAAGRVLRIAVRPREAVTRSQPLVSIVESDDLWIVARFDPAEMERIHAGQRAAVHASRRVFQARVETVTGPFEPVLLEFVDYAVSPAAVIRPGEHAAVIVEVEP